MYTVFQCNTFSKIQKCLYVINKVMPIFFHLSSLKHSCCVCAWVRLLQTLVWGSRQEKLQHACSTGNPPVLWSGAWEWMSPLQALVHEPHSLLIHLSGKYWNQEDLKCILQHQLSKHEPTYNVTLCTESCISVMVTWQFLSLDPFNRCNYRSSTTNRLTVPSRKMSGRDTALIVTTHFFCIWRASH